MCIPEKLHSTSIGKVTGCYACLKEVSRCHTRREAWGMCDIYELEKVQIKMPILTVKFQEDTIRNKGIMRKTIHVTKLAGSMQHYS